MATDGNQYVCEVVLPEHAPIQSVKGKKYPRKSLAKRSAAFEMCFQLLCGQYINEHLLSVFTKVKPLNANAHLALSSKKSGKYPMRLKPTLWEEGRGTIPDKLFLTIIDVKQDGLDRDHQAIGILTRQQLPEFPAFPLFLDSGKVTMVMTTSLSSFEVNAEEVELFTDFTLLLWNHVNAKEFEKSVGNMSYWVIPVVDYAALDQSAVRKHIDWDCLNIATPIKFFQWTPDMKPEFLANKFIIDPWAGSRRWFSIGVDPTLKALDSIPSNSAKFDRPGGSKKNNILSYSITLYKQAFDDRWDGWDKTQPVMECTQVLHRQNLLAPPAKKESGRKVQAFLCPEPLQISAVSESVIEIVKAVLMDDRSQQRSSPCS